MTFHHEIAKPGGLPLMIGLAGEPGAGKTKSALRVARGVQEMRGGDVWLLDTDNRAQEYGGLYTWNRVPFGAPYSPQRFAEATRYAYDNGARIIIIDSLSDEHDGPGGLLDMHEAFLREATGKQDPDERDRGRYGQQGWARVKPYRKRWENYVRSLRDEQDVVFLLAWRATIKYQPKTRDEKLRDPSREPTDKEWSIASTSDLPFQCSVRFLMEGGSEGCPITTPITSSEKRLFKVTDIFRPYVQTIKQLDESVGRKLYEIAKGTVAAPQRRQGAPVLFHRDYSAVSGPIEQGTPEQRIAYLSWLEARDVPANLRQPFEQHKALVQRMVERDLGNEAAQ